MSQEFHVAHNTSQSCNEKQIYIGRIRETNSTWQQTWVLKVDRCEDRCEHRKQHTAVQMGTEILHLECNFYNVLYYYR